MQVKVKCRHRRDKQTQPSPPTANNAQAPFFTATGHDARGQTREGHIRTNRRFNPDETPLAGTQRRPTRPARRKRQRYKPLAWSSSSRCATCAKFHSYVPIAFIRPGLFVLSSSEKRFFYHAFFARSRTAAIKSSPRLTTAFSMLDAYGTGASSMQSRRT